MPYLAMMCRSGRLYVMLLEYTNHYRSSLFRIVESDKIENQCKIMCHLCISPAIPFDKTYIS
jgi:hypothetical protein